MIRNAAFADIPRLLEILKIMHSQSHYAGTDCDVDDDLAKSILMGGIGNALGGRGFARVAVTESQVQGFLLGALMPVYQIGTKMQATDVFWVATDGVIASEPAQLMREFVKWAKARPEVIQIYCAATSTVQSPERNDAIMKRIGFERYGHIHRMQT